MEIKTRFDSKQRVFLDFVLSHYVKVGVEELDQNKLIPLLRLRYHDSIADAVATLHGEFDVFGGSPRFLTDWRWYKAVRSESGCFNDLAVADYWANVHNLLDYRELRPPRDPVENRRLYAACAALRGTVHDYERAVCNLKRGTGMRYERGISRRINKTDFSIAMIQMS